MNHALIIEQNMVIGSALSRRLSDLGFDSFDHVWTEDDAVAIADKRAPDLILVGDNLEAGDAVQAARRISEKYEVPILMVTADSVCAKRRLADGVVLDGPFAFNKFQEAVKVANHHPRPMTNLQ